MLKTRKRISLTILLLFALTITSPLFIHVPVVQAATYSTSTIPTVTKAAGQTLGPVIVEFNVLNTGYHSTTISLPNDFVIGVTGANENARVSDFSDNNIIPAADQFVGVAATPDGVANNSQYRLTLLGAKTLKFELYNKNVVQKVKLAIVLNNVTVPNSTPDTINAGIMKLAGDFSDGLLGVAQASNGVLDVMPPSAAIYNAGGSPAISLTIRENLLGSLAQGSNSLKLSLPKGVTWTSATPLLFPGAPLPGTETITTTFVDPQVLVLNRNSTGGVPADCYTFTLATTINIDEREAQAGPIIANISGISKTSAKQVPLGTYSTYGDSVKADKPDTELIAGLKGQIISSVRFSETIAASIPPGRTVVVTLPNGVEWNAPVFTANTSVGNLAINFVRSANNLSQATGIVVNPAGSPRGECVLDNIEVNIAVDYAGPVDVQLSGSAGINDKLCVAKVIAPISISNESQDVKIGAQGQSLGKITISESKASCIQSLNRLGIQANITLEAPAGVTLELPAVKVVKGDLSIDDPVVVRNASGRYELRIPVSSRSSSASDIEISNLFCTVDRSVPEGDLEFILNGDALDQAVFANRNPAAVVVPGRCITPAANEYTSGASLGQFKIDSSIYKVNNVSKVMDVAPYIKTGRTYIPVRYLAYALGVAESDITWDEKTQKVSLKSGENFVEMIIGSSVITINGKTEAMDVAPEIQNGRTMLPARYVAEGLGYQVGWDSYSRTVLLSK